MTTAYDRICFFGDSITLGCNDSLDLGWPGRLCKGIEKDGRDIAVYNLGINSDTSLDISKRWQDEFVSRSRESNGLMIFAFGYNDAARKNSDVPQVDLSKSVDTARSILTRAMKLSEILWIGPTPLDESVNPMLSFDDHWIMFNEDIAAYDRAYANLANEIGINYLPLHRQFLSSQRYLAALRLGDGVHPADDGYALIAETVANWDAWKVLFRK